MKQVKLITDWKGYPKGSIIDFVEDSEADDLITKGEAIEVELASPKKITQPPKDKMIKEATTK